MTHIEEPVQTVIQTRFGHITFSRTWTLVGDRAIPNQMELVFPGPGGQPQMEALVEVIDGVPRLTEWRLVRSPDGREIRQMDLRKVNVDGLVEQITASCAAPILGHDPEKDTVKLGLPGWGGPGVRQESAKFVSRSRQGSRRPMTAERKQRVADVYNAQETGGIEAVEIAFEVSRSTAKRYINAAKDAGLITRGVK